MLFKIFRNTDRRVINFICSSNVNQGFGIVSGSVKNNKDVILPNIPVCIFRKNNRLLLWESKTKEDGTYYFRNLAEGMECFIVAFDPEKKYNLIGQDNVLPVSGFSNE